MRCVPLLNSMALALLFAGCVDNDAVGNDREAELDPPRQPAEVMSAGAALQGIATSLVIPQIMTPADRRNLPPLANPCVFSMTEAGEPVVVYGDQAVLKLNGKLVPLPGSGNGSYSADGVTVTVDSIDDDADTDGTFEAQFILRLAGAPNELGYHGFAEC